LGPKVWDEIFSGGKAGRRTRKRDWGRYIELVDQDKGGRSGGARQGAEKRGKIVAVLWTPGVCAKEGNEKRDRACAPGEARHALEKKKKDCSWLKKASACLGMEHSNRRPTQLAQTQRKSTNLVSGGGKRHH